MEREDKLIHKFNNILITFKEVQAEHFRWTRTMHGIIAVSYFQWHIDVDAANQVEDENMQQFLHMTNMLGARRGHQAQPPVRSEAPQTGKTVRMPSEIVIPKGDGEERRRRQEDRALEEDPFNLRGKRPLSEKKKRKKKGLDVGTLTTALGT